VDVTWRSDLTLLLERSSADDNGRMVVSTTYNPTAHRDNVKLQEYHYAIA